MYVIKNAYDERFGELEVLTRGYKLALSVNDVSEFVSQFLQEFGDFLHLKFH